MDAIIERQRHRQATYPNGTSSVGPEEHWSGSRERPQDTEIDLRKDGTFDAKWMRAANRMMYLLNNCSKNKMRPCPVNRKILLSRNLKVNTSGMRLVQGSKYFYPNCFKLLFFYHTRVSHNLIHVSRSVTNL